MCLLTLRIHVYRLLCSGFARLRALSTHFNDTPTAASRPFDTSRDGFVLGEGAGKRVAALFKASMCRHYLLQMRVSAISRYTAKHHSL